MDDDLDDCPDIIEILDEMIEATGYEDEEHNLECAKAEIERLRAALRVLSSDEFYICAPIGDVVTIATVRKYAREALEGKDG